MTEVTSFKDLVVWQKSMDLVVLVYDIVENLPVKESYILASQIQRAAISIPSNIAEGFRRKSKAEYLRHLSIALGSAAETETQMLIINKVYKKIDVSKGLAVCEEIQKMLNTMTKGYAT